MKITVQRTFEVLKIYIDGVLHLRLHTIKLYGIQTYIDGRHNKFCIDFYLDSGTITTEYDSIEKWRCILEEVDKAI